MNLENEKKIDAKEKHFIIAIVVLSLVMWGFGFAWGRLT